MIHNRVALMHGEQRKIFDLWMKCYTQQEIADAVNMTHQAVALILQENTDLEKLAKSRRAAAETHGQGNHLHRQGSPSRT